MTRRILAASILLCAASAGFAQPAVRTLRLEPGAQRRPGMPPRERRAEPVTGTASVSGRVTAADTGAPLRRAMVRVSGDALGESRATLTDPDGRFFIGELPAGTLSLFASKGGYVEAPFGLIGRGTRGRSITLADGQKLEGLDLALQRGGVVTGFVSDEYGEPLVGVNVSVLRLRWANGRRRPVAVARPHETNDRGEFRIWALPPGQYLVTASVDHFAFDEAASTPRSGYAPTYFPGTPVLEEAQQVTVTAGQEAAGVSFALVPARTVRISGVALGTDGKPMADGGVMVMPRKEGVGLMMFGSVMGGRIEDGGRFTVPGVPPGEYTIEARSFDRTTGERGEVAFAAVSVGAENIDHIVLVATSGVRMTGRLTFDPEPPPGMREDLRVFAAVLEPVTRGMPYAGRVTAEGAFELPNLQPGTCRLVVAGLPSGWAVKEIRTASGADVSDTPIEIGKEDITGIEVRITNRVTTVMGSVRGDRNQPVESYVVLAFSADETHWTPLGSRRVSVGQGDQNGVYRVRGLAPGRYYAVAVPEVPEDFGDPELMERLVPLAEPFTLSEGETKTLDLRLSNPDLLLFH